MTLADIRKQWPHYPGIELLNDADEVKVLAIMGAILLLTEERKTWHDTTYFRLELEGVFASLGYIGKVHVLAACLRLGRPVLLDRGGPYFKSKFSLKREYRRRGLESSQNLLGAEMPYARRLRRALARYFTT